MKMQATYVRRGEGHLPQDTSTAAKYRSRMKCQAIEFDESMQLAMIEEVHTASQHQIYCVHCVATEPTHVHILVSWQDEKRDSKQLRSSLRQSLSRRLSKQFGRRHWLSEGGSRRRVINDEHFDYLVAIYLKEHGGWKWNEEKGLFK
jgi:hypothetical protein